MSFDNYYCDIEEDDCFAIIPYYAYENISNGSNDIFIYIDILVFCKKVIFQKYEMMSNAQYLGHSNAYRKIVFKEECSYITFTIKDNIFNNQIIIGLYGIDKVKINFTDSIKINHNPTINMIPMYFEYLDRFNKLSAVFNNTFTNQYLFTHIGIYDFEGYFINNPSGHDLNTASGKYTVKTYNGCEQIVSLDTLLLCVYNRCGTHEPNQSSRANLKNVLIYKLYHLCKNLRENHTKKEMYYDTLEDKMAEMQTEMRIKNTYTEKTEQIRKDILEYKQKCKKLEEINIELVKKCDEYKIANQELQIDKFIIQKKCDKLEEKCNSYEILTNSHIEDISKELKLLCKSIESMKHTSNF